MATLLVYLLLGHVVGDFVLQSSALVAAKRTRAGALLRHVLLVTAAHAVALLPFPADRWLWLLPLLALAHAAIDALKAAFERRRGETLGGFAADQALHLACLVAAAALADPGHAALPPPELTRAAAVATAYVACVLGGSAVVRLVLARFPLRPDADGEGDGPSPWRMGHAIGVLERALGLTFVLLDAWAGLGGVIAAKSIARFKDLERRHFGEYYLVGTLTSLLVTVAVGAATVRALRHLA